MRSRSAVAFVGLRVVSQLVSKSLHVTFTLLRFQTLNRDRQRLFLPEIKFMRHFHQGDANRSNYRNVSFWGGGGKKEELHKSISDLPSNETLYNCPN